MKFAASIDSSFHEQFSWSMRCFLRAFYPQLELLSKLESVLSNPATALSARFVSYSESSVVISAVFTASSPGVDSILNHLLCSSIKSNSQLLKLYHSLHSSVLSSGSTSTFLAVTTTSAAPSSTEVLNPSKSSFQQDCDWCCCFDLFPWFMHVLNGIQDCESLTEGF